MLAQTSEPSAAVTAAPGSATTAPAAKGKETPFFGTPLFLPLLLLGVFLFFSSRTKKKEQQKVQDMLGNIKRGDRVQTIGGIIGTVVEARDTEILVKVDETNNTKIRFARKAIHRVIEDEAAAAEKK